MIDLLSKQLIIPQSLVWRIADDLRLFARLEPYLTRVLSTDNGVGLFTCHKWRWIIKTQEVIYHELCQEFFTTVHFARRLTVWKNQFIFTFRLVGVSRSYNIAKLGWRLGIYTEEEVASPHFMSFLDRCILSPP